MNLSTVLQGDLVIARSGKGDYAATLGGSSLDEQIAISLEGGDYAFITLEGDCQNIAIEGSLEIFTLKTERSYFRNGWRIERDSENTYVVRCNSRPIAARIAEFFSIKKSTRRNCGWYRIVIESIR